MDNPDDNPSKNTVASHDEYIATFGEPQRTTLLAIRELIRNTIPEAQEVIAYGVPTFTWNGKHLVGYAGTRHACSLYLMSSTVLMDHDEAIRPYRASKGTLHFKPGEPLPAALIRRLIFARLAESQPRTTKDKDQGS